MSTLAWRFAWIALVVALTVGIGCAAPAAPTPTAAPAAKPTAASAPANKPTETTTGAKPAATAAAKPAASADWKAEWDKTVAAAKTEGKVVVAGAPGDLYRKAASEFQKAYPDIAIEYTGFRGSDFAPKVLAEREAGQYLWDVHAGGWNTPLVMLKPRGILAPLKPTVILPQVLDDSKWFGGFEDGWVDNDRTLEYQFQSRLTFLGYVNRDVVPESELTTVDQLLDPKWKGKISAQDPRLSGPFSSFVGYLIGLKGEAWARKLLEQDLVILQGGREQMEALVRGRFPIGLGVNSADVEQFRQEGAAGAIRELAPDAPEGRRLSSGFGNLMLVNKAPHPNAAKVYINWLLSKEGQKAYAEITDNNSRRLDVEGPALTAPKPNVKYEVNEREWSPLLPSTARAIEIGKEIFK